MDELSLKRLEVAFALSVVQRIAAADHLVDVVETQFLSEHFPQQQLKDLELVNDSGDFTELFRELVFDAVQQLAAALPVERKLSLISILHRACVADENLDHREIVVVLQAARELGLRDEQLASHIDSMEST